MVKASGDWGYKVGLEASAVGFAAASLLVAGHAHAMQAMADARAQREQDAYDAAVDALVRNEAELEAYARQLASELVSERLENRRLQRMLVQKQAYLESLKVQTQS
jgi:hydroxylamine reductase (hybrid-cluster protein)